MYASLQVYHGMQNISCHRYNNNYYKILRFKFAYINYLKILRLKFAYKLKKCPVFLPMLMKRRLNVHLIQVQ